MTIEEKEDFITSICDNIRDGLLRSAKRIPADWTGDHLRIWIVQEFEEETQVKRSKERLGRRGYKEYQNAVAVNNL